MPFSAHWRLGPIPGLFCCAALYASLLSGCGVSGNPISVSIPALSAEDINGPCVFELSIAQAGIVQKGVLVLYERGDTNLLYNDATVRETTRDLAYSIVWAHQCNARSTGNFQADASKGPARMLFAALDQFAVRSGHPELATAGVILYGFSAAGVLTATMADEHPDRLLGTIHYASGSAYTDLDTVTVSPATAGIPALVLANALDTQSGTDRSLHYFERGRSLGAAWAYAVQNDTTHCCNLSTRNIILPWIEGIAKTHSTSGIPMGAAPPASAGALANFVCTPDGIKTDLSDIDCNFTMAGLGAPTSIGEESGWLPTQSSGAAWLAWVTSPGTN